MKQIIIISLLTICCLIQAQTLSKQQIITEIASGKAGGRFCYVYDSEDGHQVKKYDRSQVLIWNARITKAHTNLITSLKNSFNKESLNASLSNRYIIRTATVDTFSCYYVNYAKNHTLGATSDLGNKRFNNTIQNGRLDIIGDSINLTVTAMESIDAIPEPLCLKQIDSLFSSLKKIKGISFSKVKYTGGQGSFLIKNGEKCHTSGIRYKLQHASNTNLQKFINIALHNVESNKIIKTIIRQDECAISDPRNPSFIYVMKFNSDDTLIFLRATTDDGLCIPENWDQ